ncbi:MAG: alpha-amylase family glycosyl hydrolase [Flavobacteriales bacterium]
MFLRTRPLQLLTLVLGWAFCGALLPFSGHAQRGVPVVDKMEPPHWWNDGTEREFVLVLNGTGLADCTVSTEEPGLTVLANERRAHPDYLFVRLRIETGCDAGAKALDLTNRKGKTRTLSYPIHDAQDRPVGGLGVESGSTMYLIMPDRFANGDPSNDTAEGLREQGVDRSEIYARHGGDLQGIAQHVDYLDALGVDALWLNPVLLNDQPKWSYHGYAVTDHYQVDPRLGGNAAYRDMVAVCHDRGIRVIQDVIFNHWGHNHWMVRELPDSSWLHHWPEFTWTNYNCNVMTDPNAVPEEIEQFNKGWFVRQMPDLAPDQDPLLADLLVQNALWWISEAGIDGFRIDTYPYSDQAFMASFAERILAQHPDVFMFGECWVSSPSAQATYISGSAVSTSDSHLESVKDFQLHFALRDAIGEAPSWRTGITRVHGMLGQDGVYPDANRLVTFVDNHDTDRWRSVAGDLKRTRYGIGLVMMTRGIPCLYYGTEIGMDGFAAPDGLVRDDFPGGWAEDARSAFTSDERNQQEEQLWQFTAALGQARRHYREAFASPMAHLIPRGGQYHFLRSDGKQHLLVLTNASDEPAELDWNQVAPLRHRAEECTSVLGSSGDGPSTLQWGAPLTLQPWHFQVYQLDD